MFGGAGPVLRSPFLLSAGLAAAAVALALLGAVLAAAAVAAAGTVAGSAAIPIADTCARVVSRARAALVGFEAGRRSSLMGGSLGRYLGFLLGRGLLVLGENVGKGDEGDDRDDGNQNPIPRRSLHPFHLLPYKDWSLIKPGKRENPSPEGFFYLSCLYKVEESLYENREPCGETSRRP